MSKTLRLSRTRIEYGVNPDGSLGYNWNFSPGCLHRPQGICPVPTCWAEIMWKRQMGAAAKKGITLPDFHHPHLIPELLLAPLSVKKPSTILVNFMGDIGGSWIDPATLVDVSNHPLFGENKKHGKFWTLECIISDVMFCCPQHTFLLLTKNPKGLIPWSPFPNNAWAGVTVCNQKMFDKALIYLSDVEAKHKWLSFEPLLEEIIVNPIDFEGIGWIVIGSQSSPVKHPDIEWVQEIVEVADQAGIPVYLKNNMEAMYFKMKPQELDKFSFWKRYDHVDEFILGIELRQEKPE